MKEEKKEGRKDGRKRKDGEPIRMKEHLSVVYFQPPFPQPGELQFTSVHGVCACTYSLLLFNVGV